MEFSVIFRVFLMVQLVLTLPRVSQAILEIEEQDVSAPQCDIPCHYDGNGYMNCTTRSCNFPPQFNDVSFWHHIDGFVTNLNLHGNQIHNVTTFHKFEYLVEMDLSSNGVRDIEAGAFAQCPVLEVLILNDNSLKQVENEMFEGLNGLKVLDLSENSITSIDEEVFRRDLRLLETLILTRNKITSIESYAFFNLNQLQSLHLDYNELREVTSSMLGGLEVTHLYLDFNYLTQLPELTVSSTIGLEYLSLSGNRISVLDENAFMTASDLQFLDLSGNRIRGILPHTFEDTKNLEQMILDGNPIEEILPGVLPKALKKFSLQVCLQIRKM